MYGRSDPPQQWSVHAEFTISHPGASDPDNRPRTNTVQDENGVRMSYCWTPNENVAWPTSGSASGQLVNYDGSRPVGYQRGNLFFTSTPPQKFHDSTVSAANRLGVVQDSDYGSDLLSVSSPTSGSLSRRPILPYNRKCRSTCNIVLSTNIQNRPSGDVSAESGQGYCGRTQSLRCQTPAPNQQDNSYNFYGCGDPWCHHLRSGDDFSCQEKVSPAFESEDQGAKVASRANTFTAQDRISQPCTTNRKDASVQTFEMIDKCTSPLLKARKFTKAPQVVRNAEKIDWNKPTGFPVSNRLNKYLPPLTQNRLNCLQPQQKLSRSPQLKKLQSTEQFEKKSPVDTNDSKKPRTVHIDVYCTGTDMESGESSSSGSSLNEAASTPCTVFESGSMRITHERAEKDRLPFQLREDFDLDDKSNPSLFDGSDYDDVVSVGYPSKLSSYSTINDLSSSISSIPKSSTNFSISSCTIPEDYDSVANTSWKDTFSDIDSLLCSSSSLKQADSLDFVPKKMLEKSYSIDETPEYEEKVFSERPSSSSLQADYSFEYANSEDRIRIKKMEEIWKARSQANQARSPRSDRKLLLQQKKMQEYFKKKLSESKSKESDTDSSDDSEKGWTFIKNDGGKLEQRLPSQTLLKEVVKVPEQVKKEELILLQPATLPKVKEKAIDQGSLSDSDPSSIKSSNTVFFQQKLNFDPTLRSPFMILPGKYTEQRFIAKRFGQIVNTFRKPGHHIGPVKNPDCLCDHCQWHFQNVGYRNRTLSVGDPPNSNTDNYRDSVTSVESLPAYSTNLGFSDV